MKIRFFFLFLLFMILTGFVFGTDKPYIVSFKFVKTGPIETRIYLVDDNGRESYGYYSFLKETSYQGYNPALNANVTLNTYSASDETKEPFKGILSSKDVINMGMSYTNCIRNIPIIVVSGSVGAVCLGVGAGLLGYLGYEYNKYLDTLPDDERKFSTSNFMNFTFDYPGLFFGGVALTVVGGLGLIGCIIFSAIAGYNYYMYKGMKRRNLDSLNSAVSQNKFNKNFKMSFVVETK